MHFFQPAMARYSLMVIVILPYHLIWLELQDPHLQVNLGIGQTHQPAISPGFSSSREFLLFFQTSSIDAI